MTKKLSQNLSVILLILYGVAAFLIAQSGTTWAKVPSSDRRYVRVGTLQSHFSAYGSERAWNNVYYEGLIWPADYTKQDNAVIKRTWVATQDFTDISGVHWEVFGLSISTGYVDQAIFPIELKQTAKFKQPTIYVDGNNVSAPYLADVDEIDPDQIPDRIINNVVNTSIGLTLTRRILVFSQQYHENYFIKEFTFTNTGNTDYDDDIELKAPLKGVRIGWGTRYSAGREGADNIGDGQSWGKHTWVTRRGEDYPGHASELMTETNPIVQWLRCGFSWAGQSPKNSFDNVGSPLITKTGRLTSPHHVGTVVLHVDKNAGDKADNPYQPTTMGWHAGDTYPGLGNLQKTDETKMITLYDMLSGIPYTGLGGTDRFDETNLTSITHRLDPSAIHNDGGGTNVWTNYGPFDLAPGESITIVEAEGVSGINRQLCEMIGEDWLKERSPYTLPDGSTTTDKDIYKNTWVYTGKDSILQTFGRAKRNYDSGYNIPQPPLPPALFNVQSGGDRISLSWTLSESEGQPGFTGYKIYRAVGKTDTTYDEIASLPAGVPSYDDTTPARGFSYYYYIVAFNDGSNNTTGETNPIGPLHSSRFYTKTTEPAYLRRKAGESLAAIRVVPNPYNIKAKDFQYTGEPDKITFLDIPGQCKIQIFTERGDLIQTINHQNGSGDESWNSITSSRQVVVSGVYIAHFEVTQDGYSESGERLYQKGETAVRKFVIIR